MKIVLLIDHLGAGGAQRQIVGLACMIASRGVDVKLLTYFPIDFYGGQLAQAGVPYQVVKGAEDPSRRFFALRKSIRQEHPDIVIAYLDTPCMLACLIRISGVRFRLIVSERNTTQQLTWRERLKFGLYRHADAVVSNSYSQGDFINQHFASLRDKSTVIPNFVDLDRFACHEPRQRGARAVIIVVASVWASKNTKGFIQAVSLLHQRRKDFEVKWFGVTPDTKIIQNKIYTDDCQRMIGEHGLDDCMALYPKTTTIEAEYLKADYFCLPSFYEGTPNAMCEAMACSLPIICSRVCDNPQYVHEGENGFLFDPHDPHDIADKLDAALGLNDGQYAGYCARSRAIAQESMSQQTFVQRYLALSSSLLDNAKS